MIEAYNQLIKKIDKNRVLLNEPMKKHTTFKIGGPADIFIKVEDIEELKYAIEILNTNNIKSKVIGNGSNILVKDRRN
ncbi:MAG: hypothetical protein Q4G09_01400 [Clostridia bacterium]|nr:hypothetical protein [Clostridia bacterium]